jgi:AcrR family transcriptional regulator
MSTGRTYGGESADVRAARRRRHMLDAGLELFGTAGYRQTTVRQLCREARVADRYFYLEFADTEDLLVAVYDECLDRLNAAVLEALGDASADALGLARACFAAFLGVVEDDPRLARLVWFEVLGVSPRVEERYLGRMRAFGELLTGLLAERGELATDPATTAVLADAAIGGVSHVVLSWAMAGFATPRAVVVEALARFLDGTIAALRTPHDGGHTHKRNQPSSE